MPALLLSNRIFKILVVSTLNQRIDTIDKIISLSSKYDYVIINGGLNYATDFERMKELLITTNIIYCIGRKDLLTSLTADNKISEWISNRPNIVVVNFQNRNVLIMDGGIPYGVKSPSELLDNLEISFVSQIEGVSWHSFYWGEWGYVISNNPLTDKKPQYYRYSLQLGNHKKGQIYAHEVNEKGLGQIICL